jgi:YidC/Oxa1 family membrane protein insertase
LDNRRLLLAAFLSLLVILGWQYFFAPPPPAPSGEAPVAEAPAAPSPAPAGQVGAVQDPPPSATSPATSETESVEEPLEKPPVAAEREERIIVERDSFRAVFTNRGAQLVSFELKEHASSAGGPVDLVQTRDGGPYPLGLVEANGASSPLNDALFLAERSFDSSGKEVLDFRYRGPVGEAAKSFSFGEKELFDVDIRLPAGSAVILGPGARNEGEGEAANRFARKSAIYAIGEEVERVDSTGATEPTLLPGAGLAWFGLEDTYFLTALLPAEPIDQVRFEPMLLAPSTGGVELRPLPPELSGDDKDLRREFRVVARPAGDRLVSQAYFGGKQYDRLAELPRGLERAVNLGFFKILARPLLIGLRWIYQNVVANYGWAIILMTIIIRLLLFPLTHKSVVSMQKMQELNPKLTAIRNKWRPKLKTKQGKPNPEAQRKMNEEIMALYKQEGVNPAGGCLPMLLQIPVLFAFYNLLSAAIELRGAPWILWIHDLSVADPIYVLPIVMGASQFVQQKLTPAAGDPMQRRIFALMPIFCTILFLGFPAGLVLYWLTNNLLGIVQQLAYKRWRERRENVPAPAPAKKSRRKD